MLFTEEDKKNIENAIIDMERKTSGEIVPVIVKDSDNYPVAHFRAALIVPLITLIMFFIMRPYGQADLLAMYFVASMVFGYVVSFIPFIRRLFIFPSEMQEEFKQAALEHFVMQGVMETKERNAVLLYISLFERQAIVVADSGIQKLVNNDSWEKVIDKLIANIKQNKLPEGIINSIEDIGDILKDKFPFDRSETDELPNKLIIDV